ncbi:MAG: carbohydrate-binding domain-containing protein [bacterium]
MRNLIKVHVIIAVLSMLFALSCDNNTSEKGGDNNFNESENGDSGNRGDTTGDSGDTGDTTGNAGDTGDTAGGSTNTGNTGSSGSGDNEVPDGNANNATRIYLEGNSIRVEGKGASADGAVATITDAGLFYVTGTLNDGQVLVDTASKEMVNVVFDNAVISCSTNAPFAVMSAKDVTVFINDNTENVLTDASGYIFTDGADEPNAALYSKSDLVISGNGTLTVNGNYNDGIGGKDDLKITGGTIIVNAVDDGIRGKDSIKIKGGNITINSLGDGLKSDNKEDPERGYILIEDGIINITSGADGMDAFTNVLISGGEITVKSGNGSNVKPNDAVSTKGIKGSEGINISGGSFNIDSSDDCIHSNGDIVIDGGNFILATGDDGVHADNDLTINSGVITITKSYEGLEASNITINDGNIHITSSDDGINCAGGDGSGGWNPGGGPGGGGPGGGGPGGGDSGDYLLTINGGYIWINAEGDGLDSNGDIEMTGGVVFVNGPTKSNNGAVDIGDSRNNYFKITGGVLIAAGSSGMAVGPDTVSTQNSVLYNFSSIKANTLFHVRNSSGEKIFTFEPMKQYSSVVFSMPELTMGQSYEVYSGGSDTGANTDGYYEGGAYSPGTKLTTFTISGVSTKIGSGGRP